MIHFEWPWVFAAALLPLLWRYLFRPAAAAEGAALRVPTVMPFMLGGMASTGTDRKHPWSIGFALAAWLLLVSAAARPVWLGAPIDLPVSGRDLMLAVDLSGSMQTPDFVIENQQVDRLSAVKKIAGDFIERRVGDRLGLILFGLHAYVQAPLTFDRKTIDTLLQESAIGLAGQQTAIGEAIGLAVKELKRHPDGNKVLILLTDGANDAGEVDPLAAAQLAAKEGLTIYTIGIGADSMLVRSLFGAQRVNPSQGLDEDTLKTVAEATGGQYFRARDVGELNKIYGVIDRLQPVDREHQTFRPERALFFWPLGIAMILAAAVLWVRSRA
ncbi:MAG: VWA domain-containing protein [Gammaproteobacteria bacterium]|nr:VWA domain-containing protein [Gammaproteobacteria bacterium]